MAHFSTLAATSAVSCLIVALSGCGGSDPGAAEAPVSDEDSLTATHYYDCRGVSGDALLARLELAIGGKKAKITDVSHDAKVPDKGVFDPTYRPTPAFAGSTRYVGFEKLANDFSSDVASVALLVSHEIQTSADHGKIFLRTAGPEGGSTDTYACTSKAKPFAVDLAIPSRLFCDLDHLMCVAGDPPGQTCLSDLFASQISHDASLRLTFLDHFGVNATTRREAIGTSSQFARTKSTVHGAWGSHALDLTYRAGVTYVGTLKVPNGAPQQVSCSDLAMLD